MTKKNHSWSFFNRETNYTFFVLLTVFKLIIGGKDQNPHLPYCFEIEAYILNIIYDYTTGYDSVSGAGLRVGVGGAGGLTRASTVSFVSSAVDTAKRKNRGWPSVPVVRRLTRNPTL